MTNMHYLRWKKVKTRKEHFCWGCARKFPIGSRLESGVSVYERKLYSVYWCETCQKILNENYDSDDTFGFGELGKNDEQLKKILSSGGKLK